MLMLALLRFGFGETFACVSGYVHPSVHPLPNGTLLRRVFEAVVFMFVVASAVVLAMDQPSFHNCGPDAEGGPLVLLLWAAVSLSRCGLFCTLVSFH